MFLDCDPQCFAVLVQFCMTQPAEPNGRAHTIAALPALPAELEPAVHQTFRFFGLEQLFCKKTHQQQARQQSEGVAAAAGSARPAAAEATPGPEPEPCLRGDGDELGVGLPWEVDVVVPEGGRVSLPVHSVEHVVAATWRCRELDPNVGGEEQRLVDVDVDVTALVAGFVGPEGELVIEEATELLCACSILILLLLLLLKTVCRDPEPVL